MFSIPTQLTLLGTSYRTEWIPSRKAKAIALEDDHVNVLFPASGTPEEWEELLREFYRNRLSIAVENAMEKYEADIQRIAAIDFKRAVFLGSGPRKGVAEESRLKLQELTDGAVMCAFDSFLGFRHGPKAVVNGDTLIVYLLSDKPAVQRYELDLVRQIKARAYEKASILICQHRPAEADSADLCIEIGLPAEMPECYSCVSYIFVAQLLGMFKSIDFGLSPDAPSVSGNISRVVEGVTIYN